MNGYSNMEYLVYLYGDKNYEGYPEWVKEEHYLNCEDFPAKLHRMRRKERQIKK